MHCPIIVEPNTLLLVLGTAAVFACIWARRRRAAALLTALVTMARALLGIYLAVATTCRMEQLVRVLDEVSQVVTDLSFGAWFIGVCAILAATTGDDSTQLHEPLWHGCDMRVRRGPNLQIGRPKRLPCHSRNCSTRDQSGSTPRRPRVWRSRCSYASFGRPSPGDTACRRESAAGWDALPNPSP